MILIVAYKTVKLMEGKLKKKKKKEKGNLLGMI